MALYLLLLLIPSASAVVDCRTACRNCRGQKEPAALLEVYCSMCEECKERRREKMESMKHSLKEGPAVDQNQVNPAVNPEFHYPSHYELPSESNLQEVYQYQPIASEDCPVQPPCSDEEDVTPTIKKITKETTTTISTTTTTTSTTTTKRPCPAIRPCKKTTIPPIVPPLPPPAIIPPQYPVSCVMPMYAVPNMPIPCPGYYPYGLPVPPAPGTIAPGYIRETGRYDFGEFTPSIVDITGTTSKRQKAEKKDYVYMYIGVPKSMKIGT